MPTVNFQYGETFGKASQKYFNDYRNEVLNSSKSLYSRGKFIILCDKNLLLFYNFPIYIQGGYFPTSLSNNPELVVKHRSRVRDMDLFAPKYELNNYNYDRTKELNDFYKVIFIINFRKFLFKRILPHNNKKYVQVYSTIV